MENTIKHFFEFLQTKENKKPRLRTKLVLGFKIRSTKVRGNLDLSYSKITSLPEGLEVGKELYLRNTTITLLPEGLEVGGYIHVDNNKVRYFITKFPKFAEKIVGW